MTATLTPAAPRTLPCEAMPDAWFKPPGREHIHDWHWQPRIACHGCPVRRACIERELATDVTDTDRLGMVLGGWVWLHRRPRPHPDDLDLYAAHYPKETR